MASTPPARLAAAAQAEASEQSVTGSMSARTGTRPAWTIAWTAPQKVIVEVSTLAPGGSPRARSESSIAAVHEATATALPAPTHSARSPAHAFRSVIRHSHDSSMSPGASRPPVGFASPGALRHRGGPQGGRPGRQRQPRERAVEPGVFLDAVLERVEHREPEVVEFTMLHTLEDGVEEYARLYGSFARVEHREPEVVEFAPVHDA